MKALFLSFGFALGVYLALFLNVAFALPSWTNEVSLIPQVNNTYTLGTTSKLWKSLYVTEICLSGDCRTAWPAGGAGGTFSTTSADFWQTQRNFFSTSSADYLQTQRNYFSTSSADYWKTQNNFYSTTSANFWSSVGLGFSTTSSDYWLTTKSLSAFSTTSANYWASFGLGHSTSSFAYNLSTYDKGYFFSTTSADAWGATKGYITGTAWGSITGTLSNQTDLANALYGKLGTSSPLVSGSGLLFPTGANTVASAPTTTLAVSGPFTTTGTLGALVGGSNSTINWTGLSTTSQPASSNLLVSNGAAGVFGVATTSATCAGTVSCTTFTIIGASPVTLTGSASGGAAWPFTPSSYAGTAVQATSSPIWLTLTSGYSLIASSTLINFASTTAISVSSTGYFGTASTSNLTVSNVSNALLNTSASGVVQATSFSGPLTFTGGTLTIAPSSDTANGYLSAADHLIFTNKVATGTTFVAGNIPYWGGTGQLFNISTGTVSGTNGITVTASRYALNGALAIDCTVASLTAAGCLGITDYAKFNMKVATGQPETKGQLAFWTTTNGTPSTLGSVATGTLAASGLVSVTASNYVVGPGATVSLANVNANTVLGNPTGASAAPTAYATSSLFNNAASGVTGLMSSVDWGLLHTATSTFTAPLVWTGSTNAVTCNVASVTVAGCLGITDYATFNMKVATSGAETAGQLAAWGTTNGTPAKLFSVATGTISATSPVTVTAGRSCIGGGCVFAWDFSVANTWTGLQTFNTGGILVNASSTIQGSVFPAFNRFGLASSTPSVLWGGAIGTTTVMQNAQFVVGMASSTTSGATETVDWDKGNHRRFILNTNTAFVINSTSSNPRDGGRYLLEICQDPTGSRTATFATGPTHIRWADNATTTITATANKCTMIGLIYEATYSVYKAVGSTTNMNLQ